MDFPEELLAEILSHLRANSASFRDFRVAFTCKDLYREFGPLIKQQQTALLMDALDRQALAFWGPTGNRQDGEDAFRESLKRGDQDGQDIFFTPRRNIEITVRSSGDVDFVWSLHAHLQLYRELGQPIFNRLILKLESTKVKSTASFSPETTYEQLLEDIRKEAKTTLKFWGTVKDQERLARALRAFSLLAVALVKNELDIQDGLRARLEEPALTLANLEALDQTPPIPNAHSSRLVLTCIPSPRIFPFRNLDAAIRGSSTSLKELHLVGCLSPGMSDDLWSAIVRRWTFTQLTQFTIKHIDVPLVPLMSFLQRNPTITTATFALSGVPSIPAGRLQCEYVRELTATPEVLLPLLRDTSIIFSNLETLKISQEALRKDLYPNFKYCTLDDVTTIFSCIPATAPSLHTLSLNLAYPGELREWLTTVTSPDAPSLDGPSSTDDNGAAVATNATSPLAEALGHLHQISTLHFTVSEDPRGDYLRHDIWPPSIYIKPGPVMDFVAAFPALKTVHLLRLFYRPGDPSDHRDSYEAFWPEVSKIWTKAGSALEKVEINGIGNNSRQRPAVWFRGDAEPVGGFAAYPPVMGQRRFGVKRSTPVVP